jgi:hypothetical protein
METYCNLTRRCEIPVVEAVFSYNQGISYLYAQKSNWYLTNNPNYESNWNSHQSFQYWYPVWRFLRSVKCVDQARCTLLSLRESINLYSRYWIYVIAITAIPEHGVCTGVSCPYSSKTYLGHWIPITQIEYVRTINQQLFMSRIR